jgi:hypothetical protein
MRHWGNIGIGADIRGGKAQAQTNSGGGNAADGLKQAAKDVKGAVQNALTGVKSPQDVLKDLTAKNSKIQVWEAEVTETPADRVPGYIQRGKTNLKITGPITEEQLKAISDALSGDRLFRLDFSAASFPEVLEYDERTEKYVKRGVGIPRYAFEGHNKTGSLIFPEGLTYISRLGDQGNLVELKLPETIQQVLGSIGEVPLPKIVFPASLNLETLGSKYAPLVDSVAVVKEGKEAVNLGMIGRAGKEGVKGTLVLPASLKSFFVISDFRSQLATQMSLSKSSDGLFTELYCYAAAPPVYRIADTFNKNRQFDFSFSEEDTKMCLEGVKTIYVPAASVKAYEDAWFNYTTAEFKPIPANLAAIDLWYATPDADSGKQAQTRTSVGAKAAEQKTAKGAANTALRGISPQDALKSIMAKDSKVKPWESEVTETGIDRAAAWIARGKSNLKISGAMTEEQLKGISKALEDYYSANSNQLFRLDFSAASFPEVFDDDSDYRKKNMGPGIDSTVFYGAYNLGSVILPEGLTYIVDGAFKGKRWLVELKLPDSLRYIGGSALNGTALAKIVFPASCSLEENFMFGIFDYPSHVDSAVDNAVVVVKEGKESINLAAIGYNEVKNIQAALVLPSTLKSFCVVKDNYTRGLGRSITELYCYALAPPAYRITDAINKAWRKDSSTDFPFDPSNAAQCFKDVKTIYVPAGSEKAYEDAWFNYTAAEFKPIPADLAAIDKWY